MLKFGEISVLKFSVAAVRGKASRQMNICCDRVAITAMEFVFSLFLSSE